MAKKRNEDTSDAAEAETETQPMVPRPLEDSDLAAKSGELAQLDIEEMDLRERKTASAKAYTAKLKEVNRKRTTLAHELKTGVEMVPAQGKLRI